MGKTSLAMNLAENVLVDRDTKGAVLIFSLEMPGRVTYHKNAFRYVQVKSAKC